MNYAKYFHSRFRVRLLERNDEFAVDLSHPHTRDHVLAMGLFYVCGNEMPIQAYEIIHRVQIRGVAYRANGLTSEDLMASLTCYSCKIAFGQLATGAQLLLHLRAL